MENEKKSIVLSCIQPTAVPTLGNYLGALKNWKYMSEDYDCYYAIADLHAITVRQEPAKLRKQSTEMYALLLALGLDPDKNVVFVVFCSSTNLNMQRTYGFCCFLQRLHMFLCWWKNSFH